MKALAKRRALFDAFSASAKLHFDLDDTFVCPLCLKGYARESLSDGSLTLEHLPQRKLGGTIETLTCRECNNALGSGMESHLAGRVSAHDTQGETVGLPGTIVAGGERATIETRIIKDNGSGKLAIKIVCRPERSKPGSIERIAEEIVSGSRQATITMNLGFKPGNANSGLLKTAYLLMFHYFGYSYVRFDFVEAVRQAIWDPAAGNSVFKGIFRLKEKPPITNGIAVVSHPAGLCSFVVFVELKGDSDHYWAVLLPGFGQNDDFFERVQCFRETADLKFASIPYNPKYIEPSSGTLVAYQIWNQLLSPSSKED